LLVRQFGDGGDDVAPRDDEQVVDPFGVDLVAGVHKVAAFDDGAAVGGSLQVGEVQATVRLKMDIFQKRSPCKQP